MIEAQRVWQTLRRPRNAANGWDGDVEYDLRTLGMRETGAFDQVV